MMGRFLEYVPGDGALHRMNPTAKILCALFVSIACFATGNLLFIALMLAAGLMLARRCGVLAQIARLVKAVLAFSVVLAVIQLLTTPTGAVLVSLPWGYIGTGTLLVVATTVLRLVAAAVPLCLVMYVTKLDDIANALVENLHIPYRYAFTFMTTVRFIPAFMDDMRAIMEAQTARGVEFDAGGPIKKMRLLVPLCVPLLVSSVRKTNSTAIAAEVRGFYLRGRASSYKTYPFAGRDWTALVGCVLLLALAVALRAMS